MQFGPLYAGAAITFFMAMAFAPLPAHAQATSGGPVDAKIIEDLVAANRILVNEGCSTPSATSRSATRAIRSAS